MSSAGRTKVPKDPLGRYQTDPRVVDACLTAFHEVLPGGLEGIQIVDAGCGEGAWSLGLALQFPHRPREVVSVDVDREALWSLVRGWRALQADTGLDVPHLRHTLKNFLSLSPTDVRGATATVMNPPFHLTEDFIAHAKATTPWVGALFRATFLSNVGPHERGLWDRLHTVCHLTPRPGFLSPVDADLDLCTEPADPSRPGGKLKWTAEVEEGRIPSVLEYKTMGSDSAGYVFAIFGPRPVGQVAFRLLNWRDMWRDKVQTARGVQ